jgi:hypothetical protein
MRSAIRSNPQRLPRVASREHGPLVQRGARTPKILRALLVAAVAAASLLAATLQDAHGAAAPRTGVVTATTDGVTATVTYVRRRTNTSRRTYAQLRLTIQASGRTTLRRLRLTGLGATAELVRPQLTVREITGDGVPDVIVDIFTGGAHCCSVSTIVQSTPKSWGFPIVHNWADHGYRLDDAGGTPTPEFVADDARFTGAYSSYAGSAAPIRLYSMEGGTLHVVTTQFPDWIRRDITQWERRWQDVDENPDPAVAQDAGRGAAAAWIADLVMLAQFDAAKAVLAAATARGDLDDQPAFAGQLGHDLKTWQHLTNPAAAGLTDAPTREPTNGT